MDLGYPFDEEEDFYVLRIALDKEQIDEVIRITETYKNGGKSKSMPVDSMLLTIAQKRRPSTNSKGGSTTKCRSKSAK